MSGAPETPKPLTNNGEFNYAPTAPYVLSEPDVDWCYAIVRTEDGEVLGTDGWQQMGVVEDASFTRDLAWIVPELNRLAEKVSTLGDALSGFVSNDGRYVVLCDDGSLVATDDLMDGDNVLVDRGEGW